MADARVERDAVLRFLREEAARMRGVANDYTAEHNDRQTARKWLIDAELLGKIANRIERGEHQAAAKRPSAATVGPNTDRLAEFVYELLSDRTGSATSLGIERVRRPSQIRSHIEVLFADGRDVIVWFEENGVMW